MSNPESSWFIIWSFLAELLIIDKNKYIRFFSNWTSHVLQNRPNTSPPEHSSWLTHVRWLHLVAIDEQSILLLGEQEPSCPQLAVLSAELNLYGS